MALITSDCGNSAPRASNGPNHLGLCALQSPIPEAGSEERAAAPPKKMRRTDDSRSSPHRFSSHGCLPPRLGTYLGQSDDDDDDTCEKEEEEEEEEDGNASEVDDMVSCSSTPSLMGDQALRLKEDEDGQQAVAPTHQYHQSSSHAAAANGPSNGRWRTASKRKTPARSPSGSPILRARLAIGETVILTTSLFIAIETPTKGTGGCHQMTVSPTATPIRDGGAGTLRSHDGVALHAEDWRAAASTHQTARRTRAIPGCLRRWPHRASVAFTRDRRHGACCVTIGETVI